MKSDSSRLNTRRGSSRKHAFSVKKSTEISVSVLRVHPAGEPLDDLTVGDGLDHSFHHHRLQGVIGRDHGAPIGCDVARLARLRARAEPGRVALPHRPHRHDMRRPSGVHRRQPVVVGAHQTLLRPRPGQQAPSFGRPDDAVAGHVGPARPRLCHHGFPSLVGLVLHDAIWAAPTLLGRAHASRARDDVVRHGGEVDPRETRGRGGRLRQDGTGLRRAPRRVPQGALRPPGRHGHRPLRPAPPRLGHRHRHAGSWLRRAGGLGGRGGPVRTTARRSQATLDERRGPGRLPRRPGRGHRCPRWCLRRRERRPVLALVRPPGGSGRVQTGASTAGGALAICYFDWLPLPGNVVAATESLILEHNPEWPLAGGLGMYPLWTLDVAEAGFDRLETFSFDVTVPYSHDAWRGRIRASAGVAASLPPDAVAAFDLELAALLDRDFPGQPLGVPHRVWALVARAPTHRAVARTASAVGAVAQVPPAADVALVDGEVDTVVETRAEGGPLGLLRGSEARLGLAVGPPVRESDRARRPLAAQPASAGHHCSAQPRHSRVGPEAPSWPPPPRPGGRRGPGSRAHDPGARP